MDAKAVFASLDTDTDSVISSDELTLGMLERGVEPQDISTLFRALDTDGSGGITLDEFVAGYGKFGALIGTEPNPEPSSLR